MKTPWTPARRIAAMREHLNSVILTAPGTDEVEDAVQEVYESLDGLAMAVESETR